MRTLLFGADCESLDPLIEAQAGLERVEERPDVVVCFGGDGTLLAAELRWPGIPKVPIRNSRRGIRCIPHPPDHVIERLAKGDLVHTEYMKLECAVRHRQDDAFCSLAAINEFNVHMGHVNSAVRFKLWLDDEAYESGLEIIGDGFVVCTPFGSTAYFNQITRGVFHAGLGVAFKFTAEHTNHLVLPDTTVVRAVITRGPAVLAFDNAPEYFDLTEGDELIIRKHAQPAVLLTWDRMKYPSDSF